MHKIYVKFINRIYAGIGGMALEMKDYLLIHLWGAEYHGVSLRGFTEVEMVNFMAFSQDFRLQDIWFIWRGRHG